MLLPTAELLWDGFGLELVVTDPPAEPEDDIWLEEGTGLEEDAEGEDIVELLMEPTRDPVPQGILSPLGWADSAGGVVEPEASAMANRVVQ